jgi:hypothetical protein
MTEVEGVFGAAVFGAASVCACAVPAIAKATKTLKP